MDSLNMVKKQKMFVTKDLRPKHWVHCLISIFCPCWIIVWIYYCIFLRKVRKGILHIPI